MYIKKIVIFVSLSFVATIISATSATAAKIQIDYAYNSVGICHSTDE